MRRLIPLLARNGHKRITITLYRAQGVRFVTLHTLPWRRQDGLAREIPVG